VARQVDAVAQRHCGFGARGDDGKVEDRERYHGANLVPRSGRTKGRKPQVRRAPTDRGHGRRSEFGWEEPFSDFISKKLPIVIFDHSFGIRPFLLQNPQEILPNFCMLHIKYRYFYK
jgi:hypothetical protein